MKNIRPTSRFRGLEKQRFRPACRCWSSWPFRRLGHAAIIVIFQLAAVSCCAGAQPLHNVSQPTPALLVATIRSCPATVQQPNGTWGCAYLPVWSTTALQPGPPASFPLLATLSGGPATAAPSTCCDAGSTFQNPPPPTAVSNFTSGDNTTPLLPQLDMSLLAPSSLVVPPNGTLTLTRLNITGAQLPAAPFPLPTTSFLSLLAIRLSPGARLQLSNVIVTTPSCVSLALHQELACRSAPSPNFTVTPTSLMVHSFTTASLSAHDVVLTCSGKQLPAPCTVAVVRSGVEVLRAVTGWVTRGDTPLAPLYLWVQGTVQLSRPSTDDIIWFGEYGSNGTASGIDKGASGTGEAYLTNSVFRLTSSHVVIGGPPDRSSVLDLTGSSSLFGMEGGAVQLQNLTLRGLPLGPAITYPASLMRLPLWTWAFMRKALGSSLGTMLHVSSVTIELPPEEMALWRYARGAEVDQLSVADAMGAGNTFGPPCITEAVIAWVSQEFRPVAGCSSCILAVRLVSRSSQSVVENALLVEEGGGTPQEQQQVQQQISCDRRRQVYVGQMDAVQGPAPSGSADEPRPRPGPGAADVGVAEDIANYGQTRGLLQMPPRPCSPLCNLLPGAGALEALAFSAAVNQAMAYALDPSFVPSSAPPPWPGLAPASPLSQPLQAPDTATPSQPTQQQQQQEQRPLPPPPLISWVAPIPTLVDFYDCCWGGVAQPIDLTFALFGQSWAIAVVPMLDTKLQVSAERGDQSSFASTPAIVELPGCLLLGDPVGVRTLDLAGLPNTFVLEREPLVNRALAWGRPEELRPVLDSFRQQRLAAGYRGLLTEPVSLTVRHMVLINLPAAGPFVQDTAPGSPPPIPQARGGEPSGEFGQRRRLGGLHEGMKRPASVLTRALQQAQQPEGEPGAAADHLGGLSPSLTNFTSCVWSLQLDRAAVGQAVRGRMQQGEVAGASSGTMQSPVDVSYVLLESVQLVVPERELLLLAWTWATNATRHAADPGLAEQLQLMLDGSWLAGGAAALQQLRASLSSPGAAPALPAGLRLVFEQLVWCGLLGSNITLTSQLPAPTALSYQPLDLDLPVAYGNTGPDPAGPQGGGGAQGPPAEGGGAIDVPSRTPPALASPAHIPQGNAVNGPPEGGHTTGKPTANGAGGVQGPVYAGDGSSRQGSSMPVGLVAGLVAGLGVSAAVAAGMAVLVLLRKKRSRAEVLDKDGPGLQVSPSVLSSSSVIGSGCANQSGGQSSSAATADPVAATLAEASASANVPALLSRTFGTSPGASQGNSSGMGDHGALNSLHRGREPSQTSLPPKVRAVVQQATMDLRLHLEQQRHGMQQPQPQSQPLTPRSNVLAAPAGAAPPAVGAAGTGPIVGLSTSEKVCASDAGSSFLASLPNTSVAGNSVRGSTLSSLSKSLTRDSGGDGGGGDGGGGDGGGTLVLLRELGRGAQGVVFAGRWRGLDVAVKSVLMQRLQLQGQEQGSADTWHGPSLSTALAEGSIATAMSHAHVVATYATYVHGPEEEQHQPPRAAATAVARASPPLPGRKGRRVSRLRPTPRRLSSGMVVLDLHGTGSAEGGGAPRGAEEARHDPMSHLGVGQVVEEQEHGGREAEEDGGQEVEREGRDRRHIVSGTPREAVQLRQSASLLSQPRSSAGCSQPPAPGPPQVEVWKLTLVQELCNGGSLRDSLLAGRLARRCCGRWPRALRPGVALRLALHVARGSAHLHRHGVLWNDLAAANVLLHFGSAAQQWHRQQEEQQQQGQQAAALGPDGSAPSTCGADAASLDFVAKVADFGLSRRLPEDATHASGPAGRSGLYIAPEVVRYGRCTPASDVYAYGVLLWEVAAGVPLPELLPQPEGGAVRSWLAQQALVPPEEAAALPAELLAWPGAGQRGSGGRAPEGAAEGAFLPAGYVALAEQCLQGDPGARPSFEEACARLEEMLVDR